MCTVLIDGGSVALGPVTVLKFGSSLLGDERGFRRAVGEIRREVDRRRRVIVVVSAVQGVTDGLLAHAHGVAPVPGARLLTQLLRTGEDASVALMGMALIDAGVDAHVLVADELGLRTEGPLRDANPVSLDLERLATCLRCHEVVVVPGFVGRDRDGHPSVLGRGGSDLTALFLADRIGAEEVRLVKDVDGVFISDPQVAGSVEPPLESASWQEVERVGNGVVQPKALHYAERVGLHFRVGGIGGLGTRVGPGGSA